MNRKMSKLEIEARKRDPHRASGRTTARAFKLLADAQENIGTWQRGYDHFPGVSGAKALGVTCATVLEMMGFEYSIRMGGTMDARCVELLIYRRKD